MPFAVAVNTGIGRNSVDSRRAHQGKEPARSSVEGDKLSAKVTAALAGGMDPDDVGRLVLDAILSDTFWVFTDARLLRHVQEQVDTMVDDRALSRLRLF